MCRLSLASDSSFLVRISNESIPPGSVNWCQPRLKRMKHWLVHWVTTISNWIGKISILVVSTTPGEVECVRIPKGIDQGPLSFISPKMNGNPIYPIYLADLYPIYIRYRSAFYTFTQLRYQLIDPEGMQGLTGRERARNIASVCLLRLCNQSLKWDANIRLFSTFVKK